MQHFTENLRRLRTEKGYTQEQLAAQLGVSAQSVSRWECGNTMPDVMLLPKIARIYGVTVDDLYREEIQAYANYAQRLVSVYEATGRTEDFLAAEQEFASLLAGPHTADDLRSIGVLYHYMLRRCASLAKEYLDAAIHKADKTHWVYSSACQQRIALMCDLGKGAEEAKRYEAALEHSSDDPMAWLLCVAAYHYADDPHKAYELAIQALTRFPEHPALHVHAGDICRALKQYDEAFMHWNRVLELDASYMDASYSMGFCYEELGRYSQALQIWKALHRELISKGYQHECQFTALRIKECEGKLQ